VTSKQELSAKKAKPPPTIILGDSGDLRRVLKAGASSIRPSAARVISRGTSG
jgi:hypothetical protein